MTASAQTDSLEGHSPLPVFSSEYYSNVTFLKQTYNYEVTNKKRALKSRAIDMFILSAMVGTGAMFAFDAVTMSAGWSDAIILPGSVVVLFAAAAPFALWSKHLSKASEAIQVETAYILPLGKQTEVGPAVFSSKDIAHCKAIGLGIKTSF